MRILVTGSTGQIGSQIVKLLSRRGHEVIALARPASRAAVLQATRVRTVTGDIRAAEAWTDDLPALDGVVHAASDFGNDMGDVETRLLDRLLTVLGRMTGPPRLIVTGGCWLYGATGGMPATEETPFHPLPAFVGTIPNLRRVLEAEEVAGLAVHPGMVYSRERGPLARFAESARAEQVVEIVGNEAVRWPLVHARDLAELYLLALEHGTRGTAYNGASIPGMKVGELARAIGTQFGGTGCRIETISADVAAARYGEWARGFALDQTMSGEKAMRELGWRPAHTDPVGEMTGAGHPAPHP